MQQRELGKLRLAGMLRSRIESHASSKYKHKYKYKYKYNYKYKYKYKSLEQKRIEVTLAQVKQIEGGGQSTSHTCSAIYTSSS